MAYGNYFLGPRIQSVFSSAYTAGGGGGGGTTSVGRVVKVVYDETTPVYNKEGELLPIGGLSYRSANITTTGSVDVNFAIPLHPNYKVLPVENELIMLIQLPSTETQISATRQATYYVNTGMINLWNSPHHNALPTQPSKFATPIGKRTPDRKDINPLYPFPGDNLIEGRLGQSIRMGGYKSKYNILTDDSNQSQPFILISNGQIKTNNGIDYITENIDEDANSIYFLSDHKVPITPANTKRDSYNTPPTLSNQYKGNQVVINGGRLYFNAKEESVLLSAKESVGLNGKTVNLDGVDYIGLDANQIYLGAKARTATQSVKQPVILGKQFELWMIQLLETLVVIGKAMKDADAGGTTIGTLQSSGPSVIASVRALSKRFGEFQSKKVFVE
jgi:hypothetical protein